MSWLTALRVVPFVVLGTITYTSCELSGWAQEPDQAQADKTAKPEGREAIEQRQSTKDRELTRRIRRALVTDKSLSTYAKNIKIVVHDGAVTLSGLVRSERERDSVKAKAAQLAGAGNVKDEISVKNKK